jgi:hypothetical protein
MAANKYDSDIYSQPVTSNLRIKIGHRLGHIQTDIDWIILICQKSKRPQNQ